jgi:uncharacterized protein
VNQFPKLHTWLFVLALWVACVAQVRAQRVPDEKLPPRPSPPRLVNDYVNMLSAGQQAQLEQKLRTYNDSTSSQVTIVIVKSTKPYEPSSYAYSLGRKWGVGQADKDNGLVLLWATDDRKIFIAPGRGLEGAIPDITAGQIVRKILVPYFKQQQYYEGLDAATTEIFRRAGGEYKADPRGSQDEIDPLTLILLLAFIAFFIFIFVKSSKGGRGGGGTGYRGGGGPVFFPYSTFSGWGNSSGSWGSGGGDGGSSFGGFGGGDFSGGGAGGDY